MPVREEIAVRRRTRVALSLAELEVLLQASEGADQASAFRRPGNLVLHKARKRIARARDRRLRAVKRATGRAAG